MNVVYCQIWEESERGWGTRPDGYSLHLTLADAEQFRKEYLDHQHEYFESIGEKGVPDEYTRPYGEPYRVKVSDELYKQLVKDKNLKEYSKNMPESVVDVVNKVAANIADKYIK